MAKDWLYRLRGDDPVARGKAAALMSEAGQLSEAGRRAESVATGERGLQLWRSIARTARAEVLPSLAEAVLHHSNHLGTAGEHARALRHAEEALALADEVVTADHGRRELLVLTQANLALRLKQSGRAAEAQPLARTAADSAGALPGPAGAWVLGVLAQVLAESGEHAEALAVSERTRTAWRQLADGPLPGDGPQPGGGPVEEARALHNHANRLFQAGRWQEAVEASTAAVARHRALAGRDRLGLDRLARKAGLANALRSQAIMLFRVARRAEALAASEESVALEREISAEDPVAGRAGLASALSSYATGLAGADRAEQARVAIAESVELYRALATADRAAYLGRLAEALSNQAALAEADEAVLRYEEVVGLRRELVAGNRATYLPWLARALNLLADRLADLGRAGPGGEAVELARECFAANRAGFLPHYAFILRRHAKRLDAVGLPADAIAAGAEAIQAGRENLAANRAQAAAGLATALTDQANRLLAQPGVTPLQTRDALALRREAADLQAPTPPS